MGEREKGKKDEILSSQIYKIFLFAMTERGKREALREEKKDEALTLVREEGEEE